jgi:hypothetical protein
MTETDHRVRDPDAVDDIELDADDVEEAREKALDFLENMDDDEHYRSGFVDACVMMDRILTDPEYFGLQEDSDE